jgi:hypothetical protein
MSKNPSPATCFAAVLADKGADPAVAATTAHRVCRWAKRVRALNETSCNRELSEREQREKYRLETRVDAELLPYGYALGNPWGLCEYACPIGSNGSTSTNHHFLA